MRIPKGCPLCEDDVLGTSETGYFCRRCNLIFKKHHIVFRHGREELKGLIDRHFDGYGAPAPRPRPALTEADHRVELNSRVRETGSSFESLRRSVEEAKRLVDDAEAGRLPPPVTLKEALQAAPARPAPRATHRRTKKKAVKKAVKASAKVKPRGVKRRPAPKAKHVASTKVVKRMVELDDII